MKTETFPLLRDAYQIIDGIPDNNFDLSHWVLAPSFPDSKRPDCGTIACAGGWLALHPDMKKRGLRRSGLGKPVFHYSYGYEALALFFGIEWDEARNIFSSRGMFTAFDPPSGYLSDKQLWLYRVRNFLAIKDVECAA